MNDVVALDRTLTAPAIRLRTEASRRRIVINGRFVGRSVTGVERYATEIVRALDLLAAEEHPLAARLRFCLAVPSDAEIEGRLQAISVERVGLLSSRLWEQFELPRWSGGDPIVNLCNTAPVLGSQNITCVHDAHVWLLPGNFSPAFRMLYRVLVPLSLRRSRRWVTVSRFSAEQLARLGIADRMPDAITPNGSDHALRWSPTSSSLDPTRLPERYLLALGSRSLNKNLALVHQLADRLAPEGIHVLIAGGGNRQVFGQAEAAASSRAVELGRVSDDDLALLFEKATGFLFPSLYEGFGLPPLEAMRLGCPVIASNTSAMPEVLGDAAILCSPVAIDEWEAAVHELASNEDRRLDFVRRGRERAVGFTWRASALTVLRLLDEVASAQPEAAA
ncbi:MAG: glycosyltransferase family 1 protein [Bradyrhizobiaceae bacterium]|nr:MAG: glycosyltransferase family 1 protein [Bradyrhizobiaceae bacterium]